MDARLAELLDRFANPHDGRPEITGPHRFEEVSESVSTLRSEVYADSAPHLLGPVVRGVEERLAVDDNSLHLCAWNQDGSLSAALRLAARPVELPALSPRCEELAATRPDFGEIGRVVTAPGPGRLDAVTRLFAAMVKHFLDTGEATGVTGVCRRRVVRFYARFGMAAIHDDPLGILGRDHDDYFVVAGSFEHMVSKGMYRLLEGPGSTRVLPGRDPTSVR